MSGITRGNFQQPSTLHRTRTGIKAPQFMRLRLRSSNRWQQQMHSAAAALRSTDESRSSSSDTENQEQDSQKDSTTPFPCPEGSQQSTPQQAPGKNINPGRSKASISSIGQDPDGPEPRGFGGPPNNLPPQLQRVLLLLTEFGGIYGTAAVAIAWFTHVDPFGHLHWDADHIRYGIQTFLPILALDALLMLPDYSIGPEDTQEVAGMFFGDPAALRNMSTGSLKVTSDPPESVASDTTADTSGVTSDETAAAAGDTSSASTDAAAASGSSTALLRLRLAMELLQQVYTRANPGIGLNPIAELAVVCVATLADEMLYRAVGLTLLGLWVRDRLFEAGADETAAFNWLGQQVVLSTPVFAQYGAVALIASLGIGGFAASALREKEFLKRMQVLHADGKVSEKTEDLKAQLMSQISSQNIVMYGVEGFREVTASIMAGVSFVVTGNLAAPLAGSLAAQTLFSAYQRYTLVRTRKKRKELLDKMKQRSQKLQAAMAAALVTKQASQAAEDVQESSSSSRGDADATAAGEASSTEDTVGESSSSDNVDFLTLVLQAAEQQEKQRQQQQQQDLQQQLQHNNSTHRSSSDNGGSHSGNTSAAADSLSTAVDWVSPAVESSDDGMALSSSSSSNDAVADVGAAQQHLEVLLEDMLRSPAGLNRVKQWMATIDSSGSGEGSNSSGGSLSKDPRQAVDELLADPVVKARLLDELQEQLCIISEAQAQKQK